MTPGSKAVEFDDSAYSKCRKRLLNCKGDSRQQEFLQRALDCRKFIEHFEDIPRVGQEDPLAVASNMTEHEFKSPPSDTESSLYSQWRSLPTSVASRSTFWANFTLSHIKAGRIKSHYLAVGSGSSPSGKTRITKALRERDKKRRPERIDNCVRTILRRLGGLPEIRGNRSVYVDCPFARAWWRERMVEQAASYLDVSGRNNCKNQIRAVVGVNQTYWEKLIDRIVFRNSTFGSVNIRGAFLRKLGQEMLPHPKSDENKELAKAKSLIRLCRRATAYQGKIEMSILDDEELNDIMEESVWDACLSMSNARVT